MPCWSIHLGVCREVNKKFKLDNDLVLFGSILPDFLDRSYSHYYDGGPLTNFDLFLDKFKDNINNPLVIGYYIHLLTDYYYNDYIYSKSFIYDDKLIGIKLSDGKIIESNDFHYCRRIKQDDFKNFGSYLINNNLLDYPKDYNKIYKCTQELGFSIDKDKIKDKVNYFSTDDFLKYNSYKGYLLFDKDTYDRLYEECISFIIEKINDISL